MFKSQEKTILILHGWGSSSQKWQKIGDMLSKKGFSVIIPDFPGFGKNCDPPIPWNVDDYVNWVKEFTNNKKLENFFLLGHSFGGRVAIKFTVKYPKKVQKLILVSSAGIKPKTSRLNFLSVAKKFKNIPGFLVIRKIFYKYILRKTDYLKVKGVMKETFKKIIKEDLIHYFSQIKASTLIIWGDKDKLTPISDAHIINKQIKNSKLEILKNIGHAPHLKCPEKLSEIISKFLK